MKRYVTAAIVGACLFSAGLQGHAAKPQISLSSLDKTFLHDTSQSNLGELAMKHVVDHKATDPRDKQFAQEMDREHRQAQTELRRLASRVRYKLPDDVDETEKQVMARLQRERKARFAESYKSAMVEDHAKDIAKTRTEIKRGRNPQVKAFAREMLAVLQNHLRMARELPGS